MNILITGGLGYVGSKLIPKLIARGHHIKVLDIGYFGYKHMADFCSSLHLIREDVRELCYNKKFAANLVKSCNCIIHLAAISNDPSGEIDPKLTFEVNSAATYHLGLLAKSKGIAFIFASTCSVYGETYNEVNEGFRVAPCTTYAKSKVEAEQILDNLTDSNWRPVILRGATLFGYSPRMRFDLVVNLFTLKCTLDNSITINGDGCQWRPFLHVDDFSRAFIFFAEKSNTRYTLYNVSHENKQIKELAYLLKTTNRNLDVAFIKSEELDRRNYRVNTGRLWQEGFRPELGVRQGMREIARALVEGVISDVDSPIYRNVEWLKNLTKLGFLHDAETLKSLNYYLERANTVGR